MKTCFVYFVLVFLTLSCINNKTIESTKAVKKSGVSRIKDQSKSEKEKDCDSGEEVLKKIEVRKDSLSLNNLESGCSIDSNKDEELKL